MNAFGTSELTIVRKTPRFGETRYVCDIPKMVTGILETYEAVMAESARYPCAIHLHPTDYQYMRTEPRFVGTLSGEDIAYFMSMRVIPDSTLQRGTAELSVCPGCLYTFGICVNRSTS